MKAASILLLGAGGHARSCIDVLEQEGRFAVAGLTGLAAEVGTSVLGYPVIGTDDDLPELLRACEAALVTVGQIKSPEIRIRLFTMIEAASSATPAIVSPRAYVSRHATVGEGSIVLHGAVVNAGARIGRNCIVNSLALVEHDAVIGDHCHIATTAAVNSGVRIGSGSFIGSGTVVRQGVGIGERCVIGMAQRISADCEAGSRIPSFSDKP